MITVPDMLVQGLNLPELPKPPGKVPPGTRCAITGVSIEAGYPIRDLVTDTTAEFLDTFRGNPTGWLSEHAARTFKAQRATARNMVIFEEGSEYTAWSPMIARASAAADPERPCWSDLVRDIWPERQGQRCYIMLTTDTKKRLWPRARVGTLGRATAIYIYDSSLALNETRLVDWSALIDCLNLIEVIYTAGFVKTYIQHGLWSYHRKVEEVGYSQSREWERALAKWRSRPEFAAALLVAQKHEEKTS